MKTSTLRTPAVSALGALALALATQQAAHGAIIVDNTGASPACSVTEVTLGGNDADVCAGYFGDLNNSSPATEKAKLDAVTDGDDWTYVFKVEEGSSSGVIFGGIAFTLSNVSINSVSGVWTFSWNDTDLVNTPNLPLYIDLAAGFKAGSGQSGAGIAFFLFDDFLLTDNPISTSGTFNLAVNKGLSHESLFVRYGSTTSSSGGSSTSSGGGGASSGNGIPEPGVLALLGAGFLAQGLFLHKRRRVL